MSKTSKTVRGRAMNSPSRRIVSGENVTAVTSDEALDNVIAAKSGADNAIGALEHSTKDYAKLRNKESKTKKWFLKEYAVKEKRDAWNAAWETHALAKGKKASDAYATVMVSCRVQYGRARYHGAALILATNHDLSAKEVREAKEVIASYGDSKKTANEKPFADRHLDGIKSCYRRLDTSNSNAQIYNDDMADLTKILKRHGVNVLDLQKDNKPKTKKAKAKKAKRK
jgi:hypothetical protein